MQSQDRFAAVLRIARKPLFKGLIGAAAFVLVVGALKPWLLRSLGAVAMQEDAFSKVDVVVVLNGAFPRSVLAAADLSRAHQADLFVLTREREWDGMADLRARGAQFPRLDDLQRKALEDLGVPRKAIVMLDEVCVQTVDEARALKRYLAGKPELKKIALVSRRSHTRRAKKIFTKVLGTDIEIYAKAFEGDPVTPSNWYRHPWYLYEVTMELLKFAWLYTLGL